MKRMVVLDPGHGGRDPGAIGPTGVQEKVVTLAVAMQVVEILRAAGITVVLTRSTDRHFAEQISADLYARTEIANQAGADIFVSIHCNSSTDRQAHGTETYHYIGSAKGKNLAQCLQRHLVAALNLVNRGVKQDGFAVLRRTLMPAALLEIAFISNPAEESLLKSLAFQGKASQAIARGIAEYLGVDIGTPLPPGAFGDVPAAHWAAASIERLAKEGVMTGYQDGTFRPSEPITRAEMAVVLERLLKQLDK